MYNPYDRNWGYYQGPIPYIPANQQAASTPLFYSDGGPIQQGFFDGINVMSILGAGVVGGFILPEMVKQHDKTIKLAIGGGLAAALLLNDPLGIMNALGKDVAAFAGGVLMGGMARGNSNVSIPAFRR